MINGNEFESDHCSFIEFQKQKEAESQKESDREVALKRSVEEVEAKNKEILLLEQQVKELEQRLQLAESKAKVLYFLRFFPCPPHTM